MDGRLGHLEGHLQGPLLFLVGRRRLRRRGPLGLELRFLPAGPRLGLLPERGEFRLQDRGAGAQVRLQLRLLPLEGGCALLEGAPDSRELGRRSGLRSLRVPGALPVGGLHGLLDGLRLGPRRRELAAERLHGGRPLGRGLLHRLPELPDLRLAPGHELLPLLGVSLQGGLCRLSLLLHEAVRLRPQRRLLLLYFLCARVRLLEDLIPLRPRRRQQLLRSVALLRFLLQEPLPQRVKLLQMPGLALQRPGLQLGDARGVLLALRLPQGLQRPELLAQDLGGLPALPDLALQHLPLVLDALERGPGLRELGPRLLGGRRGRAQLPLRVRPLLGAPRLHLLQAPVSGSYLLPRGLGLPLRRLQRRAGRLLGPCPPRELRPGVLQVPLGAGQRRLS